MTPNAFATVLVLAAIPAGMFSAIAGVAAYRWFVIWLATR